MLPQTHKNWEQEEERTKTLYNHPFLTGCRKVKVKLGSLKKTTERGKARLLRGPRCCLCFSMHCTAAAYQPSPRVCGMCVQVSFRHRSNPVFDESVELVVDGATARQGDLAVHVEVWVQHYVLKDTFKVGDWVLGCSTCWGWGAAGPPCTRTQQLHPTRPTPHISRNGPGMPAERQ